MQLPGQIAICAKTALYCLHHRIHDFAQIVIDLLILIDIITQINLAPQTFRFDLLEVFLRIDFFPFHFILYLKNMQGAAADRTDRPSVIDLSFRIDRMQLHRIRVRQLFRL